jgi:hypothetical protein
LLAKFWIRYYLEKIFREQGSLLQVARMAASYIRAGDGIAAGELTNYKPESTNDWICNCWHQ